MTDVSSSVWLRQGDRGEGVRSLQTALNRNGFAAKVDGDFGPDTRAVVEVYQRSRGLRVDGVVGHDTARALDQHWPAGARTVLEPSSEPRYPADIIAAAQATQRSRRVPASVSLAQWALESDYGTRMPPGSNNPFGIKAAPGQPNVVAETHEVINGETVTLKAAFRAFPSIDDAFHAHAILLSSYPAYRPAMEHCDDPDAFADALTGVYATDEEYGAELKEIIARDNLRQYDMGAA